MTHAGEMKPAEMAVGSFELCICLTRTDPPGWCAYIKVYERHAAVQ